MASVKKAKSAAVKPVDGKLADLIRELGIKGARCDDEDTLALDAYLWVRHAEAIAALGRVRKLQLFKAAGRDLEQAMQRPELAQMTSLSLTRNRILEPEATSIANSPYLTAIESLDLGWSTVSGKSLARAITMRAPALRRLDLEGNKVGAVGARALAASALAQQLTHLNLLYNACGDDALAELLGSPAMRNLETLELHSGDAGPASRASLVANPLATRLATILVPGSDVKELLAKNKRAKQPWTQPPAATAPTAPTSTSTTRPVKPGDGHGPALVDKLATCFDETTRSVYIDWLLERGDGRAELATLDPQWVANAGDDKLGSKVHRTQSRLAKEFAQTYRFKAAKLGYAHGLLVEVEARAQFFIDNGAELFANEPIRSIVLSRATAKDLPKLAKVPGVHRLAWVSVASEAALVEQALALFPKASIAVQSPEDDLDAVRGDARIRGLTLSFPRRDDVTSYAKDKSLAKIVRVDFDDYFCSDVFPEYRQESDAAAVLGLGWRLAWVGTRITTPENLAKLRAKVADVVMRYD